MCLGVPAEIVEIPEGQTGRAKVSISGVERLISTDLLIEDTLQVGDWVLVHVGFALSRIDADEAAITLEQIRLLGGEVLTTEVESFATSAIGSPPPAQAGEGSR